MRLAASYASLEYHSMDHSGMFLPKRLTIQPLPGDPAWVALMDGPLVLAGLTDRESILQIPSNTSKIPAVPMYEHQCSPAGRALWTALTQ